MKSISFFVSLLVVLNSMAQINGKWVGQAQSVAGITGVANIKIDVKGRYVTGSFETQMNGLVKVYFEGSLTNSSSATCLGYIDNQPGLTVVLQKTGTNLIMNLYNGQTFYLNAVFKPKISGGNTGAAVHENIVGTWKFEESRSNTKTTEYWRITEDGQLQGSQNSFFMTGYGQSNTNVSGESNNEPIPWIQNFNAMGARLYTKNNREIWIKIPKNKDQKLFDYQIRGDRLLLYFDGKNKNGEKVGL